MSATSRQLRSTNLRADQTTTRVLSITGAPSDDTVTSVLGVDSSNRAVKRTVASLLSAGNAYTPDDGTDWPDPDPTTVTEALDHLAAERAPIKQTNGSGSLTYVGALAGTIGASSVQAGNGSQATASNSTAYGDDALATGTRSTAIGNATRATHTDSTCVGTGISSVADGSFNLKHRTGGTSGNVMLGNGNELRQSALAASDVPLVTQPSGSEAGHTGGLSNMTLGGSGSQIAVNLIACIPSYQSSTSGSAIAALSLPSGNEWTTAGGAWTSSWALPLGITSATLVTGLFLAEDGSTQCHGRIDGNGPASSMRFIGYDAPAATYTAMSALVFLHGCTFNGSL